MASHSSGNSKWKTAKFSGVEEPRRTKRTPSPPKSPVYGEETDDAEINDEEDDSDYEVL